METTAVFSISEVGDLTKQPYSGDFTVKTVLTRREHFIADRRRREIIGAAGDAALSVLQDEAFMLGQLFVRIIKAPEWWTNSDSGLDLPDPNVAVAIFEATQKAVTEARAEVQKKADEALAKLRKTE